MTTTTPTTATTPARLDARPTGGGFRGALAMEWTKLWSVRSTWWSLIAGLVLMVGFSTLIGVDSRYTKTTNDIPATGDALFAVGEGALVSTNLMQFALIALAMLAMTSEYSTGSMRGTLQWVPRRLRMLGAKTTVVVGVLVAAGAILGTVGALTTAVALGPYADIALADVVADVATIALYTGFVGALTLGIGAALRSAAGTLTVVVLLVLVLPGLLQAIGIDFIATAAQYLPGSATNVLLSGSDVYSSTAAMGVLAAWAAASLVLGGLVLRRRDA